MSPLTRVGHTVRYLTRRIASGVSSVPAATPYAVPVRTARDDTIGRLSAALAATVDLVVLNDAPPLLARRIVTSGRRLFCSDPEADHGFVRDVQLRAADLAPFLRRTRRLKLAALRP